MIEKASTGTGSSSLQLDTNNNGNKAINNIILCNFFISNLFNCFVFFVNRFNFFAHELWNYMRDFIQWPVKFWPYYITKNCFIRIFFVFKCDRTILLLGVLYCQCKSTLRCNIEHDFYHCCPH